MYNSEVLGEAWMNKADASINGVRAEKIFLKSTIVEFYSA